MEVSILCPVYNGEKYLRECLESVKNQTFSDWECVIVDDGSTDGTAAICDEYAAKDSRFRVIHQKNAGVAAARNAAVREAKGDFIGWIDADDWIEPEMFEQLLSKIKEHDADVAQIAFSKDYRGYSKTNKNSDKKVYLLTGDEALKELITGKRIGLMVWNKLFRRNIVGEDFPNRKIGEDFYALSIWLGRAKKVVVCNELLYHYRMRRTSITNSNYAYNRYDQLQNSIDILNNISKIPSAAISETDLKKKCFEQTVLSAKFVARYESEAESRLKVIRLLGNDSKNLGNPENTGLSSKSLKRLRMIQTNPKGFIRKIRLEQFFNIPARRLRSRLYE